MNWLLYKTTHQLVWCDPSVGILVSLAEWLNTSEETKRPNTFFPKKKTLEKEKWILYCLLYLLSHQLMGRVIE